MSLNIKKDISFDEIFLCVSDGMADSKIAESISYKIFSNYNNKEKFHPSVLQGFVGECIKKFDNAISVGDDNLYLRWFSLIFDFADSQSIFRCFKVLLSLNLTLKIRAYLLYFLRVYLYREKSNLLECDIHNISLFLREQYNLICSNIAMLCDDVEISGVSNSKEVIIIIHQFIKKNHAPTKITLDIAEGLNSQGYNTTIINTATDPNYSLMGCFFFEKAQYIKEHCQVKEMERSSFYQAKGIMPNIEEIKHMLEIIKSKKPEFIISVGGGNIVSDVCANKIKVGVVTTTDDFPLCSNDAIYFMHRDLNDFDNKLIENNFIKKGNIIRGGVACSTPKVTTLVSRNCWGFSREDFVIAIIGNRLNTEVTAGFIEVLQSISMINNRVKFLFVGKFDRYRNVISSTSLCDKSFYCGYVANIIDYIGSCDLFLNPERTGGGLSAIYASSLGIPIVSLPVGDVGRLVQDYTNYKNWDDIKIDIEKLIKDELYYQRRSDECRGIALGGPSLESTLLDVVNKIKNHKLE